MGVAELAAEETHSGKGDEHEEVAGHEQVVRHRGGGGEAAGVEGVGQGGEVHAAADIGAGHHGRHLGQALGVSEGGPQQVVGQKRAGHGAHRADEEDGEHPPGLLPDPLDVALEQQQGDAHGHHIAPHDVVVQGALGGDNAHVGHQHGQDEGDDGAGDPGRPLVFLLQADCQGHRYAHDAQQAPDVVRLDQGVAQPHFKQHVVSS